MAKIVISDISTQFASTTAINAKMQQIEDEFNNKVVYRDEAGAMAHDLDMAGYRLLNTANIFSASEIVNTPAGNIGATDVQAAINELDGEKPQIFDGKTGAPTINEDTSNGYKKGDSWIDETNDAAYTCVDHTTGAAVWVQTGTDTGTVTSVGATAPVLSSGGANPTISLPELTGVVAGTASASKGIILDANKAINEMGITALTTTDIVDANGNEIITPVGVPSAVNEVTITNAAAGLQAKIQGTGEAAGAGLIIEGTGTNSSVDINSTGTGSINLSTDTGAVTVNNLGVQRTVILDTTIDLVSGSAHMAGFTQVTHATLSTNKATHAILRTEAEIAGAVNGSIILSIRNGDSTEINTYGVQAAYAQVQTNGNSIVMHNHNEVVVELNSSYEFGYRLAVLGAGSPVGRIALVGYIYEQ